LQCEHALALLEHDAPDLKHATGNLSDEEVH
jgi:hypothetical protein